MTMLRHNAGKAPLSLIPTSFFEAIFNRAFEAGQAMPTKLIWQVGQVLEFGARKYTAHNWRQGGDWSSVLNSAFRHVLELIGGRIIDPESDLPDTGHLGCNIAFLLEFAQQSVGNDDRYRVPNYRMSDFDGEPEPALIWVFSALCQFRDGGTIDDLRDAAWELARYVEFKEYEAAPVASVVISDAAITPAKVADVPWQAAALALVAEGVSLGTVAEKFGRAEGTIRKLIERAGTTTPFQFPAWVAKAASHLPTRH